MENLQKKLLAMRQELPVLPQDATNPHFKSKYTKLDTIIELVDPILLKYGLLWTTRPVHINGAPALYYSLFDTQSGALVDGTMPLVLDKPTAQGLGSALTYARRYALCTVLNLVADEDDDGNAASEPPPKRKEKSVAFADQVRATGMKRNEIAMWLKTEGGYDTVPMEPGDFGVFLNGLKPQEQKQLLDWCNGK